MLPVLRRQSFTGLGHGFDSLIGRVVEDLDRALEGTGLSLPTVGWGVPVSMWEDNENVHVEAEVPGFSENDLEITAHQGLLVIRGERKAEEGREYILNNRAYGRFERALTLPDSVDTDKIQATLCNGVLHLTLPKSPEAKPRRIAIQAAQG